MNNNKTTIFLCVVVFCDYDNVHFVDVIEYI